MSINNAARRLSKDLQKIKQEEGQNGYIVGPLLEDFMLWIAHIEGADNTIWEGGVFVLKIDFC